MRRLQLVVVLWWCAYAFADGALAPGTVLDVEHTAGADALLPAEVLAHYQAGEYRNAIGAWPSTAPWEEAFAKATAANVSRLSVDERGTIVEREGGQPAHALYGLPFRIDRSDPQAGVKIVWDAFYALWRIASTHDVLAIDWVGKQGLERQAVLESHTLYYEGAPPSRVVKDNSLELQEQQLAVVTAPADLHGTATLGWRFRAADKRDQSWTYVPALRRVRQVSPANRSDGFLGSDMTQDDGAFFDGKPEDFVWKLVGERDALVLADPASLAGKVERKGDQDGGIFENWPEGQKVVGYQDAQWKGLPWAPVAPVLVRRKLWLVEARPRDPYYLFHHIELSIDQETFQGATNRKFDAQGVLLRSLQFVLNAPQPIETGGEKLILPASSMGYIGAENTKAGRATVIGTVPAGKSLHERRIRLDPGLFALERLGTGK